MWRGGEGKSAGWRNVRKGDLLEGKSAGWRNVRKGDLLEDPGVVEGIILK